MTDSHKSGVAINSGAESSDSKPQVTLFLRSGKDGTSLGACPLSHQILMVANLKVDCESLPESKLSISLVDASRPFPAALRSQGISRIPAVIIGRDGEDDPETIISLLEKSYPGGLGVPSTEKNGSADPDNTLGSPEVASRDFFSRFSFCVRGITDGTDHLDAALLRLNSYLLKINRASSETDPSPWICGTKLPSLLDCEVLPKLHQVRVAGAAGLAGQWLAAEWGIPGAWPGIWCYLHAAYSLPAFTRSCPSDKEVIIHWAERSGGYPWPPGLREKMACMDSDGNRRVSLFVPAHAEPVVIG